MPKFAMLSMVAVAALVGAAVAAPYPECEACAAVEDVDLDTLFNDGKYLCCDLTCSSTPVVGCGVFGLPVVCKSCYDGDGTPEYAAPPERGTPPSPAGSTLIPAGATLSSDISTTSSVGSTPSPVTEGTPAP